MYDARHKRPHVTAFICTRISQSRKTNQISVYQGKGGSVLNEDRVSFWSNSSPLEHDSGDVCSVGGVLIASNHIF